MDTILQVAARYGIPVVEDNAHGLFGRYRGRALGTLGCLGTQSFHETKNFSCGEGGALLINDRNLVERAEILREKGTDRSRFFRGQVDKYTWVDLGSSYLPSDILAAILYSQLEVRDTIQAKRKAIWERYFNGLSRWAADNGVRLPFVPAHCEQTFHIFYLLLPTLEMRQALIEHMKRRGILSVFHYVPLHLSQMGRQWRHAPCPITEQISDQLLRLPLYSGLAESDQTRVIDAVMEFETSRFALQASAAAFAGR